MSPSGLYEMHLPGMKRTIGSCCYVAVYTAGKLEEAAT